MDVKDAIYTRRSVRQFTSQAIERDTLQDLVDAAIQAPSAINAQSWLFCVLRDKIILAQISRKAKAYLRSVPPAGFPLHRLEDMLSDPDFDIFHGAPALVVIASVGESAWAVENCALAAENLMLMAHAMGLGTCWIGLAQAWLATPEGKSLLDLPEGYVPVAPIIVGHPSAASPAVPRREPQIRWIGA